MSEDYHATPTIVVGIDGSRSAVEAALWAVDEAVCRDIPLRLLYAIDPTDSIQTERQGNWLPRRSPSDMPSPPSNRPSTGQDRSRDRSRQTRSRAHGGVQVRSVDLRWCGRAQERHLWSRRLHGSGGGLVCALPGGRHPRPRHIRVRAGGGRRMADQQRRAAAWGRRGSIARCAASGADAGCRRWSNGADPVGPPSGRLAAPLSRP